MATEISKNRDGLPDFSKAKQLEWKRKMMVFSFFLAIAVVIWLLNALSKNYTTEINYPITYSKFPDNKLLVSDVPDHLKLKVNAHGYALLSYKLSKRPVPLNLPVSSYAMNRTVGDSSKFYILTRYERENVGRQLPGELQLMEISPDSLIFQYATLVSRFIPITAQIQYQLEKDFTLINKVLISPESILVSGPDIYLDTLKFIETKAISLGTLEKSFNGMLDIAAYQGLSHEKNKVECTIELEKQTEVQVEVPIQITGLPDSLRMQTFPQRLTVKGKIGLSKYERIVPEAFWAEVKYADVLENKTRLPVILRTSPEDLVSINFSPQTVEFLLSVK